jgi:hypothetical protein
MHTFMSELSKALIDLKVKAIVMGNARKVLCKTVILT